MGSANRDRFQLGHHGVPRGAVLTGAAALLGAVGLFSLFRQPRSRGGDAPGWPGGLAHWAPSDKAAVGTALERDHDRASLVWFTVWHGALSEVFYPSVDHPCIRDLALVVTDGKDFFADERCDTTHELVYLAEGVPAYRLINRCRHGRFTIEKTIITHPRRHAILQRVRFLPASGTPADYRVFACLSPHLGLRKGLGSASRIERAAGRAFLLAERDEDAMALACSVPWQEASVGYIGTRSDPWNDLHRHARLTRHFTATGPGNTLLVGAPELSLQDGEFLLSLGFAGTAESAVEAAVAGVEDSFEALCEEYIRGWQRWQSTLLPLDTDAPRERDLFRTSTMVLQAHRDKSRPGAIVASLSIPWGQAFDDEPKSPGRGGYHMVWPRDLCHAAGGFLAAGDAAAAHDVLRFLRETQEEDGHWFQNMWVDGDMFWSAIQMDETAAPILLADLVYREGGIDAAEYASYWPMIRRATSYIVRRGTSTQEDRWENEQGYNPYTVAAVISALLVAAEGAERQGEEREARFLRETADAWYANIDHWTYVEDSRLARRAGVPGHYLRIAPPDRRGEPAKEQGRLAFWYHPSSVRKDYPASAIVSADAFAYVRFGVRAADDPRIIATAKVIDQLIKVETPYGPCWHRYNEDGYGETADGRPFHGHRDGFGRAWPLLTGERAHYELAAGRSDEAQRLLGAIERFANASGMIPEQIWDTYDIPGHDLYFGRPSGSAMPLAWAHAEYLKLRRSLRDGRVFDRPPQTVERYLTQRIQPAHVLWRPDHRHPVVPVGRILRIELDTPGIVIWGTDREGPREPVETQDSGLGIHYADVPTAGLEAGDVIRFTVKRADGREHPGRGESSVVQVEENGSLAGRTAGGHARQTHQERKKAIRL